MEEANWLLTVGAEGVRIRRLVALSGDGMGPVNGYVVESYRTVPHAEGAIWATAVSQGYEPPRSLVEVEPAFEPGANAGVGQGPSTSV